MEPWTTEVAVIGGGVMGSSIAYHLTRRRVAVTLLEAREIPSAASAASAGGVRQQGRDPREMPLAIASIARWERLEEELGADIQYRREGHLRVVEDRDKLSSVTEWMRAQQEAGLDIRLVEGADLRELAPGLARDIAFGTYTPNDGHANPILTTQAFAAAAERRGARLHPFTEVTGFERQGGRIAGVTTTRGRLAADEVVLAAGAWSTDLARQLGVELPVEPWAPQMIATTPLPPLLRQVIGALDRRLSLKQIPSGNYVIGGGWPGAVDLPRRIARPWLSSIQGSLVDSSAIFPELLRARVQRVWVGIEAQCADEVPVLGSVPGVDNLTIATGFSGHGFALSPIIGQLISELIVDGNPSISLQQLSLARFAGRQARTSEQTRRAG